MGRHLFLLDRWLDGGAHGLLGDADDSQDVSYDDDNHGGDDPDDDDGSWDDQSGF